MLPSVTFTTLNGGLASRAAGDDHVSAIVEQGIAAPADFAGAKGLAFRSQREAEGKGITGTGVYAGVHYHIGEFFRVNPGGVLWVMFQVALAAEVQEIARGAVRQVGVTIATVAEVTSVCQAAATAMAAMQAPAVIVAGFAPAAYVAGDETTLATLTADDVCVVAFGDFDARGKEVATALGEAYLPAIGTVLGAISSARVHESPAWARRFNLSDGRELDRIALPSGAEATVAQTANLYDKRYLAARKYFNRSGTFLAGSATATLPTRDIIYVERARAIHKAKRLLYDYLVDDLSAPVYLDPETGQIASGAVAYFKQLCNRALDVMLAAGELSGYRIYIDPTQDILSTSRLVVRASIQPVGKAERIEVEIGFALSLD